MNDQNALSVGRMIGGYEIVRVVGQGGFGFVYEARNRVTQERVAIKEFYPEALVRRLGDAIALRNERDRGLLKAVLQRFQEEAVIQFRFHHPHLVKVKNFILMNDSGYMVTDYLEGESLADLLRRQGGNFVNYKQLRQIMEPILSAVSYLHENLVLHRDLSPENIMVDRFGRSTLIDFGSAKHYMTTYQISAASSVRPYRSHYSPLEQQVPDTERPEGYYTDIFAVAGTLYWGLAGDWAALPIQRAFASRDPYVSIAQVSRVTCPARVYAAIDRGLSLPVKDRPATIAEFVDMLGWRPDQGREETAALASPPVTAQNKSNNRSGVQANGPPAGAETNGGEKHDEIAIPASVFPPEQSPAPVRVEVRGGKIARVQDLRNSRILTEVRNFEAWREPIISHVKELLSGDLREGTNHSRARHRLIGIDRLLAGSVADVNERQFRLGYEVERLEGLIDAYRSSADDMPSINAGILEDLHRLRIALQIGMSKLERWAEFIHNATSEPERQTGSDMSTVGEALEKMATEMERQSKYFDPELPVTFRFLAKSVKDPMGATKTVAYGAVKSAENLISFLGQKSLEIGKSSAEAVDKHISKAVAVSLVASLSGAALQLSGALPTAWVWLRPLLDALAKAGVG